MIITSSPTMEPSIVPITSIPTVSPSITGEIVSITVSQTVTAELEPSDVRDIENLVDKAYGTGEQDISSSTNYISSGSLTISLLETISSEDAKNALQESIASVLNLTVGSVDVTVDLSTGVVLYNITSGSFDDASHAIILLQEEDIAVILTDQLGSMDVHSVSPSENIIAETMLIVDADDIPISLIQAENILLALLDDSQSLLTEGIFEISILTIMFDVDL